MERNNTNELQIYQGTTLGQFHKVESFLGEGGFGFVTKCRNLKTNKEEAIKINKNSPEIVRQAKLEICILKRLRCLNPDTCNIVRWNGFFFDKDRICLNFDLLDQSLHSYLKDRNFNGLTTTELRPVISQLATALSHLRSIGLVHADLKPDNVMIVDRHQTPLQVKVIDFGLAHPVAAVKPGTCVQTLWYRAPEVMLHLPFNEAIDMWSLGITAAELSTGYPLYPGNTDYDVLRFIFETQGQPSDKVLDRGLGTGYYFDRVQTTNHQHWTFKSPEAFGEQTGFYAEETREFRLDNLDALVHFMREEREGSHQGMLVDLIKRMLHLDPDVRIKPLEVLRHPFFQITSCSADPSVITTDDGPSDLEVSIENTEETENNVLEEQLENHDGYGQVVLGFFSRVKNTVQNYLSWNQLMDNASGAHGQADPSVNTADDGPSELEVSTGNTEKTKNIKNMLDDQLVNNSGYGQAVFRFFSGVKNTVKNYFSWNRKPIINMPLNLSNSLHV